MAQDLRNKYFVRKSAEEEWKDFSSLFDGLRVLSIDGFGETGKALNIYTAQWISDATHEEDFMITTLDEKEEPYVIRENVDLSLTFIVSNRYASTYVDIRKVHDDFIKYIGGSDVYVRSTYQEKEVRCAMLDGYKPTTTKLKRGINSYIMGTVTLHTLDLPTDISVVHVGDLYIGFGGVSVGSLSDITSLINVQHYNVSSAAGSYSIVCPQNSYLWICTSGTIEGVTANGFEVPMSGTRTVGDLHCYRTANSLISHTMTFTIIATESQEEESQT